MTITYICLFLTSCINNNNRQKVEPLKVVLEENLGKKLAIPDGLMIYKPFTDYIADSSEIFSSSYRIYSYINVSCGTCINNIELWNSLIIELKELKIPVILICESDDKYVLFRYMCESGKIKKFSYPFVLNRNNDFTMKNPFMKIINNFQTVLTDKENTILLIGNPIYNKSIKELYLNYLKMKK